MLSSEESSYPLLNKTCNSFSLLTVKDISAIISTLATQANAPLELGYGPADATKAGEVELQKKSIFPCLFFEVLDCRFCLCMATSCYIHFGVLEQQSIYCLLSDAGVAASHDDHFAGLVRDVIDAELGLGDELEADLGSPHSETADFATMPQTRPSETRIPIDLSHLPTYLQRRTSDPAIDKLTFYSSPSPPSHRSSVIA